MTEAYRTTFPSENIYIFLPFFFFLLKFIIISLLRDSEDEVLLFMFICDSKIT